MFTAAYADNIYMFIVAWLTRLNLTGHLTSRSRTRHIERAYYIIIQLFSYYFRLALCFVKMFEIESTSTF